MTFVCVIGSCPEASTTASEVHVVLFLRLHRGVLDDTGAIGAKEQRYFH